MWSAKRSGDAGAQADDRMAHDMLSDLWSEARQTASGA